MDPDRLATLYQRYGPAVYSRCRRILQDDTLAEDATQEVFMRVLRHLDKAPGDEQALAWIYRISTNYCLNLRRDRCAQAEPTATLPDAPGRSPEDGILDRDACLRILDNAPEGLRAAALLYHFDGVEQGRIAQILGVSRRTVINRLNGFAESARKLLSVTGGA